MFTSLNMQILEHIVFICHASSHNERLIFAQEFVSDIQCMMPTL